jgi:hypothetical protein
MIYIGNRKKSCQNHNLKVQDLPRTDPHVFKASFLSRQNIFGLIYCKKIESQQVTVNSGNIYTEWVFQTTLRTRGRDGFSLYVVLQHAAMSRFRGVLISKLQTEIKFGTLP